MAYSIRAAPAAAQSDGAFGRSEERHAPTGPVPRRPEADLLGLHRAAGNRAVGRLLGKDAPVLRRSCACGGSKGGGGCGCSDLEDEEELRRSPVDGAARANGDGGGAPGGLPAYLRRSYGGGRPLSGDVRHALEGSFGPRLGGVRVHTGPEAAWAARSIGARAFALGKNVWFGAGEYSPGDPEGRHLLAHEVAHTLEQRRPRSFGDVRVGRSDDPAEARADRAAEAALRRERVPVPGRSDDVIRRYEVDRVRRAEEDGETIVYVDLDNGMRYRVRRVCAVVEDERTVTGGYRPARASAGADRENVYVQVSWCQGTRGEVTAGADVPAQLQDAIRRLVEGALAGRSPDDVLRDTTLTPFVDFAISESGGISVDGRVQVTVGGQGVQSGQGSINFRHGPVDVGVTGGGSSSGGFNIGLTLTFTPGRTSPTFECPRSRRKEKRLRRHCVFECTHEPINPPAPEPRRPTTRTDRESATIYFEYATTTVNSGLSGPQLTRLRALLRQGYRVERIQGYASPEGPLERRPRGRFQGNRALSSERAQAARTQVEGLCAEGESCAVSGEALVTGCGERFGGAPECAEPQEGAPRPENRGRAVAREAVRAFEADPSEMARLTQQDRQRLSRARTDAEKARIIYPYLRRASISLVRVVELPPPPIRLGIPRLPPDYFDCPEQVLERARPILVPSRPGPRR